jgi:PAS domain S-box-containing protein
MSEKPSFVVQPWGDRWPIGEPQATTPRAETRPPLRGADRRASRFLYDEKGDLLTRHAEDGTVLGASPAVQGLVGRAPWQVEGRLWHDLVHPEDRPTFAEWWNGLTAGSPTTHVYRMCRPGGAVVSVETLARRVVLLDQGAFEVHALTRDITDHVERASGLARQCRELQDLIDDIRCWNEDLRRFAADAAHDLRAPLSAIAGFAQLLAGHQGGRLDELSQHFVAMILGAAGDMGRLLEAALEHGQQATAAPDKVLVDCTEVVKRALIRLQAEIDATGARVRLEPLPVVHADPVQLGRVFQNLISNACKAARPETTAHVVVGARRVALGWHLSVTDDGTGVSPHDRDRIFQLFHRGGDAARAGGTGIGLSICRTIVERHGGRIWVEDSPGGGSRFAFFLPDRP